MTENGGPTATNDADRLPWLEPYRDTNKARVVAPSAKASRPRGQGGMMFAGFAALLVAVGGGYWLGQRGDGSDTRREAATMSSKPAVVEVAQAPTVAAAPVVEQKTPKSDLKSPLSSPIVKQGTAKKSPTVRVHRGSARREKLKSRPLESGKLASVLGKQGEVRQWPKMPSPGPAGQVIQLGAFSSTSRAERAYQARAGRYPLLASMPKVIVPIVTKPRGEILYVLRLGTQSREQSTIVCRNLRNSGDHCLVIG